MPHLRCHHENPATLPAQSVQHLRGEGLRRIGAEPCSSPTRPSGVASSPTTRTRTRPRPTPTTSASSTASAATPTRHVSAESSLSRSPTSPSSDSRSPSTPHPRPCTRPPIPLACLAFRWPYPLPAGLAIYVLGLFTFAGLTAQANVNKPSKPRIGPANRHRRPRSCAPHPRPQRRAA